MLLKEKKSKNKSPNNVGVPELPPIIFKIRNDSCAGVSHIDSVGNFPDATYSEPYSKKYSENASEGFAFIKQKTSEKQNRNDPKKFPDSSYSPDFKKNYNSGQKHRNWIKQNFH